MPSDRTNEDGVADLLVGRLPVDTPAEAQTAVERIIRYERTPKFNRKLRPTLGNKRKVRVSFPHNSSVVLSLPPPW